MTKKENMENQREERKWDIAKNVFRIKYFDNTDKSNNKYELTKNSENKKGRSENFLGQNHRHSHEKIVKLLSSQSFPLAIIGYIGADCDSIQNMSDLNVKIFFVFYEKYIISKYKFGNQFVRIILRLRIFIIFHI